MSLELCHQYHHCRYAHLFDQYIYIYLYVDQLQQLGYIIELKQKRRMYICSYIHTYKPILGDHHLQAFESQEELMVVRPSRR